MPTQKQETVTLPAFVEAMAEAEGRSGGEVFENILANMKTTSERIQEDWRNPDRALALITKEWEKDVDLEREYHRYIARLRQAPDDEWSAKQVHDFDADPRNADLPPRPIEVVEVTQTYCHVNFNGIQGHFTANVRYEDGRVKVVQWKIEDYVGSVDEEDPPFSETSAKVVAEYLK